MRQARVKFPESTSCYTICSRSTGDLVWLDDPAKAFFLRQLHRVSHFCGVQVLAYTILPTHFHLLIRVPPVREAATLTDEQIAGRVEVLYGKTEADALRDGLQSPDAQAIAEAILERERLRLLMCELSQFMKLLKQRFVQYYNAEHRRFGTIWNERFASEPIPDIPAHLCAAAAHIDLNAVRSGFCDDPLQYRYCSYAEAAATPGMARDGLASILADPSQTNDSSADSWEQLHARYRRLLFTSVPISADAGNLGQTAPVSPGHFHHGISAAKARQVAATRGILPAAILRAHVESYRRRLLSGAPEFGSSSIQDNRGPASRQRRRRRPRPRRDAIPVT